MHTRPQSYFARLTRHLQELLEDERDNIEPARVARMELAITGDQPALDAEADEYDEMMTEIRRDYASEWMVHENAWDYTHGEDY